MIQRLVSAATLPGMVFTAVLTVGILTGEPAAARLGSAAHPIIVRMKPGSDVARLMGVLRQGRDCCAYLIKAHAGQILHWSVAGAATRQVLTYPDGHVDGPGLPDAIALPTDGAYILSISPDLMAEGAFGRFVLRLSIPPKP